MCCPGCQAVAQAIIDGGMSDFYRYRTVKSANPGEQVNEALDRLKLYDQPRLQESFVQSQEENRRETALILEGIVCAACVWLNERHVKSLPGVIDFRVNYSTHRARLQWDDSQIHLSDILAAIAAIGYVAHPFDPGRQQQVYDKERSAALRRLAVAGVGAMQVMMFAVALYAGAYQGMEDNIRQFLRWVSLLVTTPVVLYSARSFFDSAWRDLRRRQLGMDVPVSLAILAAFSASAWATFSGSGEVYFDSVCMFTFFLLAGRFLEMGARHKAGQAAEELVRLLPATATRLTANGSEVVAVADLAPGDRVLVKPGESVPADGLVLEGVSSIDESLLSGESLPLAKQAGDDLVGGTVNVESPLTMEVRCVGEDTVLSAIVRLLDRAQTEKPRVAQLADQVAAWFVGAILLLAAGVYLYWVGHGGAEEAFWITLSVLVVTCPCALSLATPAAITAATGNLTRQGLLTTRGHALEALGKATHAVFDKTGTLTLGRLTLSDVRLTGELGREAALAVAAALEGQSEHPVARAIVSAADTAAVAKSVQAIPGQGIEGEVDGRRYRLGSPAFVSAWIGSLPDMGQHPGSTRIFLACEGELLAVFDLSDEVRPDAADTLHALRTLGLQVELLSGDSPEAVARLAEELKLDIAHGGMSPQDKMEHIRRLQHQGAVVAMVGDGVNDAPVLSAAQVSVAMGGGTQIARASADMILLSEHLGHLAEGVKVARRSRAVIRQNLAWALVYNAIALPLAASGQLAPWMAAIGMSFSSLVVVLNALRLR